MKYAIVESGGKQYKAVEGATIDVDRLHLEVGTKLDLGEVLLVSDEGDIKVGTPTVEGAMVATTVVDQFKAPKIIVFKYKSRQNYRVKQGHRQKYTRLKIDEILAAGAKRTEAAKAEDKPIAEAKPKVEAKPKTKTAAKTAAKPKTKTAAKPKTKTAAKPKTKTAAKPKTKTAAKPKTKTAAKPKTKTAAKPKTKTAAKPKTKTKTAAKKKTSTKKSK